jgi:hypothetical protein
VESRIGAQTFGFDGKAKKIEVSKLQRRHNNFNGTE